MTKRVQAILNSFERLSKEEQKDAVGEMIRRRKQSASPPLTDEELTLIAEERFLELDRREAAAGKSRPRRSVAR